MHIFNFAVSVLALSKLSLALPQPDASAHNALASGLTPRDPLFVDPFTSPLDAAVLERRKGGGGGGGRGGGSGGTSSGGRPSGSTGSGSGSSSSSSGNRGTTSNTGGRSSGGSGVAPSYFGGRYSGGATAPYRAGSRSPLGGILPFVLVGGALGFWAGHAWSDGAYTYRFPANVTYYNQTSMMNMTVPAVCLCSRYQECSCDMIGNSTQTSMYIGSLIGDGSYATLQQKSSTVQLDQINGTTTLAINGTLANGTTADTSAGTGRGQLLNTAGMAMVAAAVGCAFLLV